MSRIYTANDYAAYNQHTGNRDFDYSDDDYEAALPFWIEDRLSTLVPGLAGLQSNKILLAGVGLGHELAALMDDHGFSDVWGCDASAYAVARAKELFPQHAARFVLCDVTSRQQTNALRSAAGLQGNQQFRVVITDDLLPCAADAAEAQTMLTELRRAALGEGHIITVREPGELLQPNGAVNNSEGRYKRMPGFLWLTATEWRALIGNSAWVFDSNGNQIP